MSDLSGATTPTPSAGSSGHHLAHARSRLRHFLRPDGRKVHIALSPEEADKLRRTLSITEKAGFDIVIHGEEEHVRTSIFRGFQYWSSNRRYQINALRETQTHHEQARDELRLRYGRDFDEFERVVRELDKLNTELHMVTEHAVQLDANFQKYGYSAHLRKPEPLRNFY